MRAQLKAFSIHSNKISSTTTTNKVTTNIKHFPQLLGNELQPDSDNTMIPYPFGEGIAPFDDKCITWKQTTNVVAAD